MITAVAPGTAVITATANADSSVKKAITIKVRQPYTLIFDANGGQFDTNANQSRTAYSGEQIGGSLPAPYRRGYKYLGWYDLPNGGTRITSSTVLNCSTTYTVYAHWELKPESDWVLPEQVPANAEITRTSWSYREHTESSSTSLAGWVSDGSYWNTQPIGSGSTNYATFPSGFDTSNSLYTSYAKQPYTSFENATTKRVVTTTPNVGYIYWHWMYNTIWQNGCTRSIASQKGWYTYQGTYGESASTDKYYYQYFYAFASTVDCPSLDKTTYFNRPLGPSVETWNCGNIITKVTTQAQRNSNTSGVGTNRFYRFSYGTTSYTDYQKIYKYYKDWDYQSNDPGSGSHITNKVKYVKYREN